ncbi:hypothetical protein ASV17_14895 [Enterobacter hormaechei subsp. xiangfangensis]|nr:hypothetical protein ASV17_14895 [Enterobacter hormaechei subsp. xiangfangensis]
MRRESVKQIDSALTVVVNAQADVQRTINPRGAMAKPSRKPEISTDQHNTTQHESALLFLLMGIGLLPGGVRFQLW